MKVMKKKLLPGILIFAMFLSMLPATVFATTEATTVRNEQELLAAIEAIPQGGSGEITIDGVIMQLSQGLYIEEKDITFNLVNASLSTAVDEYGYGQPVIMGFGTNITINADDNSTISAQGNTGRMGVVRIDNSTDWNPETETFGKDFTLTVNGGKYTCAEEDGTFIVASGTKAVFSNVVCNGDVEEIAFEGVGITVPGEITINSGKFSNDVEEYVASGKYFCQYGDNYYVRDKEYSDAFSKVLTNGKVVFNYVKPSANDESIWLVAEDFCVANPDFYFDIEAFQDDFSKLELGIHYGTAKEEFHVVDVVWNYQANVLETAQSFIEKFPKDRPWFHVSDLELVNYWAYSKSYSENDSIINYSGELKEILGNSNLLFEVEVRGGSGHPFYTENIGSAKLLHNDTVYFSWGYLGGRAEHAIYVPENTANTKEALIAAAQKRIDEYIGEGAFKITASNETVTDYYNNTLAEFDRELADAQARHAAEMAKPENERDWFVIFDCQSIIENTPIYKQSFIESFAEGGDLHFLKKAAGDFIFNVEVVEKEETYSFVIIKNDSKLTVPSHATVDLNTNVSVSTDSSTVPLDTVIKVKKLTEGDEYNKILDILDVVENEMFDIKLHSGSLNEYVTKLEDGMFEVRIPVPEKFKGKTLIIYYVDENNKPIEYEAKPEGDFVVFTTNHFSIYTLAENPKQVHTQHSGGTATCCTKAICAECGQPYGELNPANHSGGTEIRNAKAATEKEKGYTGDTYCKGCGEKIQSGKEIPATGTISSPKTSDNTNGTLWMVLIFISGVVFTGILSVGSIKKKKA